MMVTRVESDLKAGIGQGSDRVRAQPAPMGPRRSAPAAIPRPLRAAGRHRRDRGPRLVDIHRQRSRLFTAYQRRQS